MDQLKWRRPSALLVNGAMAVCDVPLISASDAFQEQAQATGTVVPRYLVNF
jgi:hypothetical protein